MTGTIAARLETLGITLPAAPAPAANYVPYVIVGDILYISGQISQDENGPILGKVGVALDVAAGAAAARRCGLSLLAQANAALGGDLDRIVRAIKLVGFVNSTPAFTDQPEVVNGCSNLFVEVLGDAGRHARSAVSAASLPRGVSVEIEAIFQIRA